MPEQRNYRFATDQVIQMGTPQSWAAGLMPSSPEKATEDARKDIEKDPSLVDKIVQTGHQLASNKQKLISSIIQPMKGLSDKPSGPGAISPAEDYVNKLLANIESLSGMSEPVAIDVLLKVWPVWQRNGHTWDTFEKFITFAMITFSNSEEIIQWSEKLFNSMLDAAPVFTPEYIMDVALDALISGNFTKYQNLLLSLPFYKSVWSKEPVNVQSLSKATEQVSLMMELNRTPTEEMNMFLENMRAKQRMLTAMQTFYKSMVTWFTYEQTGKLRHVANLIRNKKFQTGNLFEQLIEAKIQQDILRRSIGDILRGVNVYKPPKLNSNKLFKTVLANSSTSPSGSSGATSTGTAGSGTSATTTSATSSGTLSPAEQEARAAGNLINRKSALIEQRQRVIENNLKQINNISEQKTKGLSGDLGLFSSLVTSGNVVKKIDETLNKIDEQVTDIYAVIRESRQWLSNPVSGSEQLSAQSDTISMNDMKFKALLQDLGAIKQDLKIQKIVLPKELEYFELKEEYDTNKAQLEAPVSAIMVNNLKTTTDRNGKTKTINTRVTRPIAIKNTWETGKKIVNLLMQISQALQASTSHSPMGESMAKNASNYYKAAVKQENENNKMLIDNLAKTGLGGGQVNETPVAVGKK